jgi:NIMA-interacting peptidyl-prolyl cis-trans isomerase 1
MRSSALALAASMMLPMVAIALACACDKSSGDGGPSASASAPGSSAGASSAVAQDAAAGAPGSAAASAPAASASATAPDAIIAQHILVIYKGAKRAPKGIVRTKADARARAAEALGKLQSGTPFEDVVTAYSDDTGSVDRMGSLGKFRRGDMDPAFSAAAFALRVGQVSDVVETPFGFHIIKRTQ